MAVFASASRNTPSSQIPNKLGSSWLTMITVAPSPSRSSKMSSSSWLDVIGSRPADGSSKNKMSGSSASARARPARLRIPPLSAAGNFASAPAIPTSASFNLTSSTISDASSRVSICIGSATFSPTVRELHNAPPWKSTPKRRPISTRRVTLAAHRSSPSTSTAPWTGDNNPIIERSTVLLPQPLPPITAKIDPRRTEKVRSVKTTFGPKPSVMRSQRSNGVLGGPAVVCSDAEDICARREDCIDSDYTNNANDDRSGGRTSHLGRATSGAQSNLAGG